MTIANIIIAVTFGVLLLFLLELAWSTVQRFFTTRSQTRLDNLLHKTLSGKKDGTYSVTLKEFPGFRTVDLFQAVENITVEHGSERTVLDSQHHEDLNALLHTKPSHTIDQRKINASQNTPWVSGKEQEIYLPEERFWLVGGDNPFIVRCKYNNYSEKTTLEVASNKAEYSESLQKAISGESIKHSIYRKQIVSLSFESATKDEYGDVEKPDRLSVSFKTASPVTNEEFVVDDEVFRLIQRNIIDLQTKRALFKQVGVSSQRGVLFYGPPGTGKSYACRYICGQVQNATRIFVTGGALNVVPQIFELARMYQPSILFMEDVDLIFASRDINLYSSALGDLLDHMDGLRPEEDVSVILTTNSIERMEAAIKDRPGRISQCIYFGAPPERIRQQYINQYGRNFDLSSANITKVLDMSKGATPAFIKEWINRTAQFASERLYDKESVCSTLQLTTDDFTNAYNEMRLHSSGEANRIIGFVSSS